MCERQFTPSKTLTFATVHADNKCFLTLLNDAKTTSIRMVLEGILQCDSAGLAFLIEAKRLCKQQKKRLIIEGMPDVVYALAKFCGVDTILVSDEERC